MATARPRPRLPSSPSPVGRGLFSPEYQQVRTALYGSPPQSPVVASPMRRLLPLPFGASAVPRGIPTFQDQTSPPPGMGLGGMGPGMGPGMGMSGRPQLSLESQSLLNAQEELRQRGRAMMQPYQQRLEAALAANPAHRQLMQLSQQLGPNATPQQLQQLQQLQAQIDGDPAFNEARQMAERANLEFNQNYAQPFQQKFGPQLAQLQLDDQLRNMPMPGGGMGGPLGTAPLGMGGGQMPMGGGQMGTLQPMGGTLGTAPLGMGPGMGPTGGGQVQPPVQQVSPLLSSPLLGGGQMGALPFGGMLSSPAPANPRVPTFQDQTSPPPGMGIGGMGGPMGGGQTSPGMGPGMGPRMGTLQPMGGTLGTAPLGMAGGQMPMAGGIGSLLTGNQTQQPAQNVGQQPNTLQQGAGRLF